MAVFYIFRQQIQLLNFSGHTAQYPFFFSTKCHVFHNVIFLVQNILTIYIIIVHCNLNAKLWSQRVKHTSHWNNWGNVRVMWNWDAFVQPLSRYYTTCAHICGLRYPSWNVHVPYSLQWPALLYNIFLHDLINDMILKKSYWR